MQSARTALILAIRGGRMTIVRITIATLCVLASSRAHADAGEPWDTQTIVEQAGAGAAFGLFIGATGTFVGAGLGSALTENWGGALAGGAIGGCLGGITGLATGVQLAGDWSDGRGKWTWTTGGAIVGGVLGVGVLRVLYDAPTPVLVGALSVAMLTPTIVAYHLSADRDASAETRVMVPLVLGGF